MIYRIIYYEGGIKKHHDFPINSRGKKELTKDEAAEVARFTKTVEYKWGGFLVG